MKHTNKAIVIHALAMLAVCGLASGLLTGCNVDLIDTNFTYDYAIINTQDDVIRVPVKQWKDYEDGDQIQIISADDGTVYLVNSVNCTLVNEP